MAQSAIQLTFNGGEWSPLMYGRYDLAGYKSSVAKMQNMIPLPQGPIIRRPGTVFVCKPRLSGKVRIVPYEPNNGAAFVVELGNQYVRVLSQNGPVNNSGVELWIEAPWSGDEVADVSYTQCGDRLYFWHPNHPPTYLVRSSAYIWRFEQLGFLDGPWLATNTSNITLSCNANYGWGDVTASSDLFTADDMGRHIRIGHGSDWGWGTITEFYNSKKVQILIRSKIHDTTATKIWRLGAWSQKTGYPACGAFIEDRLFAAASKAQPRTIWASKTASHHNFAPTNKNSSGLDDRIEADSAITMTLSDERVQKIRWLQAGSNLVAGTTSGEFIISSSTGSITPTSINARRETTRGVANCSPERVDNSLLYVARGGKQLHEMLWDYASNAWLSPELSLLASHLLEGGIQEIAMQQLPWNILWMRRSDGRLIGMTYMKDRNINAWHQHHLGGDGVVENIITVSDESEDILWLVVNRDGVRFIEYMANIQPNLDAEKAVIHYVDCGITQIGTARNVQTGLAHLEGKELQILADYQLHENRVVTGGKITLNKPAKIITAGYSQIAKIECLNGIFGQYIGDVYGQKNIQSVGLQLLASAEVTLVSNGISQQIVPQKQLPYDWEAQSGNLPIYSGLFDCTYSGFWHKQTALTISQSTPLPLNIIGMHINYHK